VDRAFGSHGVNQKFVHMRTNFSEYGVEMNQGPISKYGTAFPNMEPHLALVYCPSFSLQFACTSIPANFLRIAFAQYSSGLQHIATIIVLTIVLYSGL
jgi:hypothetical protein